MKRSVYLSLGILFALLLTGCANRLPMAVDSSTKKLDVSDKAVVLMTIDIKRQEKSRFTPVPFFAAVGITDGSGKLANSIQHMEGDGYLYPTDDHAVYAFRVPVSGDSILIRNVYGQAKAFPIIGQFWVPLGMKLLVRKGEVVYAGRVEAILRPRADHEYRAGPLFPLLDQGVSGMSGGTFDVKVVDSFDEDMRLMREAYPALANTPVEKRIGEVVARDILDKEWAGNEPQAVKTASEQSDTKPEVKEASASQ